MTVDPCCKRQLRTTMTNTWGANHGRRKRFLVTVGGGIHEKARVVADENWCFFLFIFQRFPLQWGRQLGTGCESLNRVIPREPITLDPIEGVVMCRVGHKSGTPKH